MTKLPTIDIKGKDYVMVKDRILYFNEMYKNGSITTHLVNYEDNQAVVKAKVTPNIENKDGYFTGYSQAKDGAGMMGAVALEVAETSAVGRALAMMGIGIVDSIASADELVKSEKAMRKAGKKVTDKIVTADDYTEDHICPMHNTKMWKRTNKSGGHYYDHRKKEGDVWLVCDGKGWK